MKQRRNFQLHILFLLFLSLPGYCQEGLHVGDKCPDVLINHIVNYKNSQAKIGDFKGKLLILDFWATWCAPCVSMIPTSDSLQRKFEDRIQILPVTDQDSITVSNFLKNINHFKNISFPSVTSDKALHSLFPHVEIPHYAWIDENSVVVAITDAEELTADNIENFLAGRSTALAVKNDIVKNIDYDKPMFVVGNELIEGDEIHFDKTHAPDLLYHSIITKYIDGFGCETHLDSARITCKNNSIGGLYRFATGRGQLRNLLVNKTVWNVSGKSVNKFSDSASFSMHENMLTMNEWMKSFSFCYELQFPSLDENKKFEVMLADLNAYFGTLYNITGGLERRRTKCYALVTIDYKMPFASKGMNEADAFDEYHLRIANGTINTLLDMLGINLDTSPPLVDETGYKGKIDIDLQCQLSDITSVNGALAKYGLNLKETEEEMEMVVIKDKPGLK